jgi:hypothetical protein
MDYVRIAFVQACRPINILFIFKMDITVKVYQCFSAKFTTRREFIAADVS